MGNTFMNEAEMEALENRMKGMSQEEQKVAIQFFDTDMFQQSRD